MNGWRHLKMCASNISFGDLIDTVQFSLLLAVAT